MDAAIGLEEHRKATCSWHVSRCGPHVDNKDLKKNKIIQNPSEKKLRKDEKKLRIDERKLRKVFELKVRI